jgi:hypothetical protein
LVTTTKINRSAFFIGLLPIILTMLSLVIIYLVVEDLDRNMIQVFNAYLPAILAVVLLWFAYKRIKLDKYLFWCPLSWFLLGAAISFGYGSLAWYHGNIYTLSRMKSLYSPNDNDILQTNILNSFSVMCVVVGYMIGIKFFLKFNKSIRYSDLTAYKLKSLIKVLLFIFLPFEFFIDLPYLYGLSTFIVPGFLLQLSKIGHIIVFLLCYLWGRGLRQYRIYSIAFICFLFFMALPGFGKGDMLMPIVSATIGYFWATKRLKNLFIGVAVIFILLFTVVAPISGIGRNLTFGQGHANVPVSQRIELAYSFFANLVTDPVLTISEALGTSIAGYGGNFWTRESFNNVQSYLMNAYDRGQPGYSLDKWFIALVPRIIWPEKPVITNVGLELDALVKNRETNSSLAPTFNGEAYWNGGWWMVTFVSLVIGIQFAQFAVFSKKYLQQNDLRFLYVAIFGISFGLTIESWVVPKYVGGYITVWVMWFIIRRATPYGSGRVVSRPLST